MATTKKRVNKTKEELQNELERQKSIKFWQDIAKVEEKHKLKVRAYIHTSLQGIRPILSAEPIEDIVIDKKETK